MAKLISSYWRWNWCAVGFWFVQGMEKGSIPSLYGQGFQQKNSEKLQIFSLQNMNLPMTVINNNGQIDWLCSGDGIGVMLAFGSVRGWWNVRPPHCMAMGVNKKNTATWWFFSLKIMNLPMTGIKKNGQIDQLFSGYGMGVMLAFGLIRGWQNGIPPHCIVRVRKKKIQQNGDFFYANNKITDEWSKKLAKLIGYLVKIALVWCWLLFWSGDGVNPSLCSGEKWKKTMKWWFSRLTKMTLPMTWEKNDGQIDWIADGEGSGVVSVFDWFRGWKSIWP